MKSPFNIPLVLLLLTVFWFLIATQKHKAELEDRVRERTADLATEIKDRRQSEELRRRILEASMEESGGVLEVRADLARTVRKVLDAGRSEA